MSIKIFAGIDLLSDFFRFALEELSLSLYQIEMIGKDGIFIRPTFPDQTEGAKKYVLIFEQFTQKINGRAKFDPRECPFFHVHMGGVYLDMLEQSWINNPSSGFFDSTKMINMQKKFFKNCLQSGRIKRGVRWVDGKNQMAHEISTHDRNTYWQNSARIVSLKWVNFVGNTKLPAPAKIWCEPISKKDI